MFTNETLTWMLCFLNVIFLLLVTAAILFTKFSYDDYLDARFLKQQYDKILKELIEEEKPPRREDRVDLSQHPHLASDTVNMTWPDPVKR